MWYSTDPRNSVHSLPCIPHKEVSLSSPKYPLQDLTPTYVETPFTDWGLEEPSILCKQNPQVANTKFNLCIHLRQNHSAASNRLICQKICRWHSEETSLVNPRLTCSEVLCVSITRQERRACNPGYASWILPHHLAIELEKSFDIAYLY